MYPQFFGFNKLPFRLRPDPEFVYLGVDYLRARAELLAALNGGPRLIVLSGPAGVGKTLLLEDALGEVASQALLCRINQPHISAAELLQALLLQFGTQSDGSNVSQPASFDELKSAIEALGSHAGVPVLILDDAHLLAAATVASFAGILERVPRLKILLAGRNSVAQVGASIGLTRAAQAVHLSPFGAAATRAYIDRRLAVAGTAGKELFTADAYAVVFQETGGAARLINVLCDAALHAACTRAAGHVSAAEILLATQDSRWPEAMARDRAGADVVAHPAAASEVTAAQFVVTRGAERIAAWPLTAGRVTIGRAPDNELRLQARFISRHHCQVVTVGGVSTIEDLGSVNGLSVNGKMVKRHVLRDADQILLGDHTLTYVVS